MSTSCSRRCASPAGQTLAELGLAQDEIRLRGAALQCRITTEDPTQGFRPDTGKITTYRSPGGAGIRLDGGTTAAGSQVSPHFDSMLVKLTCRARDFPAAVARARRALAEFRIRGVSTNIPFLQAVLDDPSFIAGDVSTSFIDERPQLLQGPRVEGPRHADAQLARRRHGQQAERREPAARRPAHQAADRRPARRRRPPGSRQRLLELGPAGFAADLRAQKALAVTDTTFRDAHQSLLATRVRTKDLLARRPARRAADPAAALGRGLGRRDLRRRAAVPRRGPVGAAREAARGAAEHRDPDAAARPQHRRLHAVPDRGHRGLRARGRSDRRRHLPDLRRAQRRLADAPGDRRGARDRHRGRRGRASATPATC